MIGHQIKALDAARTEVIRHWLKVNKDHKPLLIAGKKFTGKTTIAQHLGRIIASGKKPLYTISVLTDDNGIIDVPSMQIVASHNNALLFDNVKDEDKEIITNIVKGEYPSIPKVPVIITGIDTVVCNWTQLVGMSDIVVTLPINHNEYINQESMRQELIKVFGK